MSAEGRELVATDKPAVGAELSFDTVVMEDSQGDGCLPDPTRTDESYRCEVLGQANDLLNQLVMPETCPRSRRRQFSGYARCKYKMLDPITVEVADLV